MKRLSPLLLLIALYACTSAESPGTITPYLMHDAYFDLRDSLSSHEEGQFVEALQSLSGLPGVLHLAVGTRLAMGDKRLDSTFDIALHMAFADLASLKAYQQNPDHLAVKKVLRIHLQRAPLVFDYRVERFAEKHH